MARSTTQVGERNQRNQLQIPLMYAFREAHRARDAKISSTTYEDGERVLSERSARRRRGANEHDLRLQEKQRGISHFGAPRPSVDWPFFPFR